MLKIGVLGAAKIAPGALIKPARRTGRAEVVAVAARDVDRARAYAKKNKIPRVLDSYEALLADPELDAVYIPLPNGLHGHWTIAALQAGKHVLCEKPFTANADEARHVAEAAAAHPGLVVMEAFHYEYHPMTRRLVEIVQSGELGIIKEIDINFAAPLAKPGDIRYRLDLAGGAMMDMGCYPISLLRLLAAGPRVTGATAKLSSPGVDRAMDARFSLPEGGTARVRCSMFSKSVLRLHAEVIGSEGSLSVFNPFAPQYGHRVRIENASGTRREKFSRRATYDYQLEAFASAVEDGAPFPTTAVDAIRTMELIDATYVAAGLPIRQPSKVEPAPSTAAPSTPDPSAPGVHLDPGAPANQPNPAVHLDPDAPTNQPDPAVHLDPDAPVPPKGD
jgi:predicted dehydrogenase